MKDDKTESMIASMAEDLKPVERLKDPKRLFFLWMLVTVFFVHAGIWLTGPLRAGFLGEMVENPVFAIEFLLGLLISPVAAYFAFCLMVPGSVDDKSKRVYSGPVILFLVSMIILFGFIGPSLPESAGAKRDQCMLQIYGLSFLPFLFLLFLLTKGASMRPKLSGFLAGMAAASPAAIAMHVACMYAPAHVLIYHVSPVVVVGVLGSVVYSRYFSV